MKPAMGDASASSAAFNRVDLYAWLAAVFYAPRPDTVTPEFLWCADGLAKSIFAYDRCHEVKALAQELGDRRDQRVDASFLDAQREYARLFLGPARVLVRPFESCYCDSDRLMTERSSNVQRFYESCGFEQSGEDSPELPDHIAVELTFLSMIAERAGGSAHADEDARTIETRFIAEHLGQWGVRFAREVLTHARYRPYRAAAELLERAIVAVTSLGVPG